MDGDADDAGAGGEDGESELIVNRVEDNAYADGDEDDDSESGWEPELGDCFTIPETEFCGGGLPTKHMRALAMLGQLEGTYVVKRDTGKPMDPTEWGLNFGDDTPVFFNRIHQWKQFHSRGGNGTGKEDPAAAPEPFSADGDDKEEQLTFSVLYRKSELVHAGSSEDAGREQLMVGRLLVQALVKDPTYFGEEGRRLVHRGAHKSTPRQIASSAYNQRVFKSVRAIAANTNHDRCRPGSKSYDPNYAPVYDGSTAERQKRIADWERGLFHPPMQNPAGNEEGMFWAVIAAVHEFLTAWKEIRGDPNWFSVIGERETASERLPLLTGLIMMGEYSWSWGARALVTTMSYCFPVLYSAALPSAATDFVLMAGTTRTKVQGIICELAVAGLHLHDACTEMGWGTGEMLSAICLYATGGVRSVHAVRQEHGGVASASEYLCAAFPRLGVAFHDTGKWLLMSCPCIQRLISIASGAESRLSCVLQPLFDELLQVSRDSLRKKKEFDRFTLRAFEELHGRVHNNPQRQDALRDGVHVAVVTANGTFFLGKVTARSMADDGWQYSVQPDSDADGISRRDVCLRSRQWR
jgi:hypothetical protein